MTCGSLTLLSVGSAEGISAAGAGGLQRPVGDGQPGERTREEIEKLRRGY